MSESKVLPVEPEKINQMEGILCHFQTDRDFVKNYASSDEADRLGDLSSVCLNFASGVADAGGFGALNRLVAYADDSKFALFALNPKSATPPGPRIFGIKMSASTKLEKLVSDINQMI